METKDIKIMAAPLQGYTDAGWRRFHSDLFPGAVDLYFTPFLRVEKRAIRRQDQKALTSPLNEGVEVIPQIIFRDIEEFRILADSVRESGLKRIDLNLGCSFPPQVKHGRGASVIRNPQLLAQIGEAMVEDYSEMEFSAKMRLGVEREDEWEDVVDQLNQLPLKWMTVHPRVAAEQYGGEVHMEAFGRVLESLGYPVIFNGEIRTVADFRRIVYQYPAIKGIMIGRGLIANPSLPSEIRSGEEMTDARRVENMLEFHSRLFGYYQDTLCGEAQILSKIKPFWDYAEPFIGHKSMKGIKKATSVNKYLQAIETIGG